MRPRLQTARHRFLERPFDPNFAFLATFRPHPGEIFGDAGANRGQSALCMRHYYPDRPTVSFEPLKSTLDILCAETRGMKQFTAHNVGIGDAPGHLPLYVPTYAGNPIDPLASVVRSEAETWLGTFLGDVLDARRMGLIEEVAEISTLDSYGLAPAFPKLDVQGAEDRVLSGAMATLERHKPVILLEKTNGLERAPLLTPLGYREYHFARGRFAPGTAAGTNTFFIPPERHDSLAMTA